jgi:hypothetical protein
MNLIIKCCIALSICFCSLQAQYSIIGKWRGTDSHGKTNIVEFRKDGYFDPSIDAKDQRMKNFTVRYSVNDTAKPIWLDMIRYDLKGRMLDTSKSIIKFVGDTVMVWRVSKYHSKRPLEFIEDDKETTITLHKVE